MRVWGRLVIALQVVHARARLVRFSTRRRKNTQSHRSCRNPLRSHRNHFHSRHLYRREHGRFSPVGIPRRNRGTRQSILYTDRTSGRPSRS